MMKRGENRTGDMQAIGNCPKSRKGGTAKKEKEGPQGIGI